MLTDILACGLYLNKMKCMRPPEKWAKPSEPATKRRGPYKRRKGKNGEAEPQSDIMTDAPQEAQGQTSPAREHDEPPKDCLLQQLPPQKRQRASSVEPRGHSAENKSQWSGPAAAAAFRRAIQSSPPRLAGTANTPIEIDTELTPKPTRRLLFPSPRRHGEVKSLDGEDKPKTSQDVNSGLPKAKSYPEKKAYYNIDQDPNNDKENCPPPSQPSLDQEDEFADLFTDNAPGFQMISATTASTTNNITPSRPRSSSLLFDPLKTPKSRHSSTNANSSSRKKRTPLGTSSSISKHATARRHSIELSTPSRSAKRQKQQLYSSTGTGPGTGLAATASSMTPFTASLFQMYSSTADYGDDDADGNDIIGVHADIDPNAHDPTLHPHSWATSPSQPFDFADANLGSGDFDFSSVAADITPTSRRFANILNMNSNLNLNLNMNLGMVDMGMGVDLGSEANEAYAAAGGSGSGDFFASIDDELLYGAGLSLAGVPDLSGGVEGVDGMGLDAGADADATGASAGSSGGVRESTMPSAPSMAGLFSLYEDPVQDAGNGGGKILGVAVEGHDGDANGKSIDKSNGNGNGNDDNCTGSISNDSTVKIKEGRPAPAAFTTGTAATTTAIVAVKEEQLGE